MSRSPISLVIRARRNIGQMLSRTHIPVLGWILSRFRRLSLVGQFMLLSSPILLVGAIFIGWWINRNIEQQVLTYSLKVTSVFVDSSIAPIFWDSPTPGDLLPDQQLRLDQVLETSLRSGDFVAFHIASPDGTLIYSNVPIPPGTNMKTRGMEFALQGQVHSHITNGIDFVPDDQQKFTNLIETYFPIRDESGAKIIAVASFYQSLDYLHQSILEVQLQGWVVVGISTFLMYIMLFGVVKRGSDTIERQKLDLAESRQQIQRAAVRAAEVNEDTLRRLGADLHDGPAQDLGIALMRMEPLREALGQHTGMSDQQTPDPEVIAFDLNLIHTALQSSLQEIRNLASGLRLPDLQALDLAGTIRKAVTDYRQKTGRFVVVDGPDMLMGNEALKSATYRIVQEALNNGHIHGNPDIQTVKFRQEDDLLFLAISDNGKGFEPSKIVEFGKRRQLGLAGLQERAEILGGHLHIQSSPGSGTVITARLPLTEIAADDGDWLVE